MARLGVAAITDISLDPGQVRARLGDPRSHFGQRAKERGIASVPGDVLWLAIKTAVVRDRGDLVERVFDLCSGQTAYRFRVSEGIFYALVSPNGNPVTCYTKEMLAGVRRVKRLKKRAGRLDNKPFAVRAL